MIYLLDTNVLSEMRKAPGGKVARLKIDEHVANWLGSVVSTDMFISVISVLEIERGFHLLARKDSHQADLIRRWIRTRLLPAFDNRILPIDLAIVQRCAALTAAQTMEFRGSLLAATALTHEMTLVTRNVRHFEAIGVRLLNPWRD